MEDMNQEHDILDQTEEATHEESQDHNYEEEASKRGWVPEDEALKKGVDPKDVKDAKTFMAIEPWKKELNKVKAQNRSISQSFNKLMERFDKAELDGYNRALEELKQQRYHAVNEYDTQAVQDIDQRTEQLEKEKKTLEEQQKQNKQQPPAPEVMEFVQKNADWWQKDVAATQFALMAENAIRSQNPNMDIEDILNEVQAKVDVFRGKSTPQQKQEKTSFVAPPQRGNGSPSQDTHSFHDLSSVAKDLYVNLKQVKQDDFGKKYTVDQFIKDQLKAGWATKEELLG